MESLDHFYNNLDSLQEKKEEIIKCCQKEENYLISNGIIQCKLCSNTISNICDNPEWRYYSGNDNKTSDPTRCGMPVNALLPESSIGSSVSFKNNNKSMCQIRRYQQWNGMPYKERSLYKVFNQLYDICAKNYIPTKITEEAKGLYSIVSSTKISRGDNRIGIIAACLYFSCKLNNVP